MSPRVVYTTVQGPELHLYACMLRHVLLLLRCLHHRDMSCRWKCLHWRGLYCSWRCLHHSKGACAALGLSALQMPVLHSDLSTHCARASPGLLWTTESCAAPGRVSSKAELQSPVLHLNRFPLKGPELHLDVDNSSLHEMLLDLSIYTTETSAAPGRVYTLRPAWASPGLVYTTRVLCFTWTCYLYRSLSWTWTSPHYRVLCCN